MHRDGKRNVLGAAKWVMSRVVHRLAERLGDIKSNGAPLGAHDVLELLCDRDSVLQLDQTSIVLGS